MPPKRKAATTPKKAAGGGPAKRRKMTKPAMVNLAKKIVAQQLNRNIETKQSVNTYVNTQLIHNRLTMIDSAMFSTTQGDQDPMTQNTQNRTGDEINCIGLSMRFLLEMQQSFSDVTFRILMVKAAKGDTPTLATLFNGLTPCKLLDSYNTERYTIMYSKTIKLTARNPGVGDQSQATYGIVQGAGGPATGAFLSGPGGNFANNPLGLATRVFKIWLPGKKMFRNGIIKYENASAQTKFFNYHLMIYSYVNNEADTGDVGTLATGKVRHYVSQMYYKDA